MDATTGRWPANVILGHHPECRCTGTRKANGNGHWPTSRPASTTECGPAGHGGQDGLNERHADGESIETWDCHPDCPVRLLDEQTGPQKSGGTPRRRFADKTKNAYGAFNGQENPQGIGRTAGNVSRFFAQFGHEATCDICDFPLTVRHGKMSVKENEPCQHANTVDESSNPKSIRNTTALTSAEGLPQQGDVDSRHKFKLRASPAERNSQRTRATTANSARSNVEGWDKGQLLRNVKSAANLCDSCATHIAHALAELRAHQSPESLRFPDSITAATRQSLIQSLVPFAVLLENTDIIPTTESLSILFGSVRHAIAENTRQDASGQSTASVPTRFRYCSKAGRRDRFFFCRDCGTAYCETERAAHAHGHVNADGKTDWSHIVAHPTVKPVALMRYLVRLVTPPGGTVLDPFAGTGTTLVACCDEGVRSIGMEQDPEYAEIIKARLGHWAPHETHETHGRPAQAGNGKPSTKERKHRKANGKPRGNKLQQLTLL